jgi:hypothetical protein
MARGATAQATEVGGGSEEGRVESRGVCAARALAGGNEEELPVALGSAGAVDWRAVLDPT